MADIGEYPIIPIVGGTGVANPNISGINLNSPVSGYALISDANGYCTLQAIPSDPSAIQSVLTDSGTVTPVANEIAIYTGVAALDAGSTFLFSGSTPNVQLLVTDVSSNTIIGKGSGIASPASSECTGFGAQVLKALNGATATTAVGYGAGTANTSGQHNSFFGNTSGSGITTGSYNTFLGDETAANTTTCGYSVCIGYNAGTSMSSGENGNIYILNNGASESNTIRIGTQGTGNGQQNACFVAGIVGVTVSNTELVTINSSTGQLGVTAVPSAAFAWSLSTSGGTLVKNNGYIVTSGANSYALPSTASSTVGDTIQLVLSGGTSWTVTEATSQQIILGNTTTTVTSGTLASTAQGDWIELVYQATGLWVGNVKQGNITVV